MEERITYNIDSTKFNIYVSFFAYPDDTPSTVPYEDLMNNFVINPAYGEKLDFLLTANNKDAHAAIINSRPAYTAQCAIKGASAKSEVMFINNIVSIDINFVSIMITNVFIPMLVRLFGPHALSIYRTISGKGVHLDILISHLEKKEESYNTIVSILESHGFKVDNCSKNIVQRSVLSFDPQAFVNSHPQPFQGYVNEKLDREIREITGRKRSN